MLDVSEGVFTQRVGFHNGTVGKRHWAAMLMRYEALGFVWYTAVVARRSATTGRWNIATPMAVSPSCKTSAEALEWVPKYVRDESLWPYVILTAPQEAE